MTARHRLVTSSSTADSCTDRNASSCSRLVTATASNTRTTTDTGTSTVTVSSALATIAQVVAYTRIPTIRPRVCHTNRLSRNRCSRGDWAVAANCTTRKSNAKMIPISASRPAVTPAINATASGVWMRGPTSSGGTDNPATTATPTYSSCTSPARSDRRRRSARSSGRRLDRVVMFKVMWCVVAHSRVERGCSYP